MKMEEDVKGYPSPSKNQKKKLKLSKNLSNSSFDSENLYRSDSDDDLERTVSSENSQFFGNNSENNLKYFQGNNCGVIALSKNSSIYVFGACRIQVLRGGVTAYGYNFHPGEKMYDIFSGRGTPRLFLTHTSYIDEINDDRIKVIIKKCGFNRNLYKEIVNNYLINEYAIICCYPIDNNWLKYIKKCVNVVLFPNESKLQVTFNSVPDENVLKVGKDWNELTNYQENNQKVMICGGQGVGKSTLLRYMINTFLNHHEKVYVIDLDPGQSEFTMAGCISIICMENPIFGPNYATLNETIRSISHNIDVSFSPNHYIKSIQSLMKTYETLEKFPTLINMVGFQKGLGLEITSSAIAVINPNILIEIRSERPQKNYSRALVKTMVNEQFSLFLPNFEVNLSYDYISITSVSDATGFKPAGYLRRNISTISYFGRIVDEGLTLRSGSIPMFMINLDEITVIDKEYKSINTLNKEDIINFNIVGLCSKEEGEGNIFNCYGYGIVRCVINNILYLITPVKYEIIQKVTHFIIGLVELPNSMLDENEKNYFKPVPYFANGCLHKSLEKPRRNYLPRK
ncbi:uncharacterized protein [Onthophagus taurus]|uniref:uncharacterized protein n=1 Tax=Onthophagus taurus TaxID=166361 RepID=UPI0039BE2828